jgi:hypothetical protein
MSETTHSERVLIWAFFVIVVAGVALSISGSACQ